MRFSLAHEIAHTLFYDLSNGTPKIATTFRSGGGRTELENLERNCNRLAACLLMLTALLIDAIRRLKAFDPISLLHLVQQAGVSVEALVRRLSDCSSILTPTGFRGCIILAKQAGQEVTVAAVARPKHLHIARELRLMKPGERWQLPGRDGGHIWPNQLTNMSTLTLKVETQYSESDQDYRVAIVECGNSGSVTSHLIAFEEV